MRTSVHPPCRAGQRGVALLTALLLMLAVLLSSIAAARTAISGARASEQPWLSAAIACGYSLRT